MPRGQFYTVFTLGFATAVGLLGVAGAVALLWWPQAAYWAAWALGPVGGPKLTWLTPNVFSILVAGASLTLAYWIVGIQQTIVRWAADRVAAKIDRQYAEIARRVGRDHANEYLAQQMQALFDGAEAARFDPFGREAVRQSMAAAGIKFST